MRLYPIGHRIAQEVGYDEMIEFAKMNGERNEIHKHGGY